MKKKVMISVVAILLVILVAFITLLLTEVKKLKDRK